MYQRIHLLRFDSVLVSTAVQFVYVHSARVVDHLAVRNVVQGAPLGGGPTLRPILKKCTYLLILGLRVL